MNNLKYKSIAFLLLFTSTLASLFTGETIAAAKDSITAGQSVNDNLSLVSATQKFELGVFNYPQGSIFHYLGIRYYRVPDTIVWVANRDNPIVNSSSVSLILNPDGSLVLLDQTSQALWSSKSKTFNEPVAQLLDTGNFVVRESGSDSEEYVWQSFDYPFDTLLPGMKIGWDLKTGLNRMLTSQKSSIDPSPGEFTVGVNKDGLPQLVGRKGNMVKFRGGPWFGHGSTSKSSHNYAPTYVYNASEITFSYNSPTNGLYRVTLSPSGSLNFFIWEGDKNEWQGSGSQLEGTGCNDYKLCGNFGACNIVITAECSCIDGFKPKSPNNYSDGCVIKDPKTCRSGEMFKLISGLKWPDSTGNLAKVKLGVEDCEAECKKDCSCLAYGILEVPKVGRSCVSWFHELIDIRYVPNPSDGEDLYVRLAASEFESSKTKRTVAAIVASTISAIIFLALIIWFIIRNARRILRDGEIAASVATTQENELEMPLFDIATIEAATKKFSLTNKIGEGGFGPVYKGKLPSGQEIAVKKLAESSHQGLQEFNNEVLLISQLQHRNLVKLLGFCTHKEETLLIYEYMPNKSLDYFLFDDKRRSSLDWKMRFDIIIGIARGLLYLHRDSRLRIIHRDLKAANILLDGEMMPKVSDFGMARRFGGDQMGTITKRIVGTYGYMSPEYAIEGFFSFKSDVFSYGVLLLEIVSGKKNKGFSHPDHQLNLLGHAWKLWNEERALELIDESLEGKFQKHEALRCIHIGLLCVQKHPDERPLMSTVISMLENENMKVAAPGQPGFYGERFICEADIQIPSTDTLISTCNNITLTTLDGR